MIVGSTPPVLKVCHTATARHGSTSRDSHLALRCGLADELFWPFDVAPRAHSVFVSDPLD